MGKLNIGALIAAKLNLGTRPLQRVNLGTMQIWVNEVVVVLGDVSSVVLKSLFTPEQWSDPYLKKRVVSPAGIELGAANLNYAILATVEADGQEGSWAGELTLEIRGTISGLGGPANSGKGGDVIWVNFPGRDGQKLIINNHGLLRAGGGGGGRGGNGGAGNFIDYQDTGHLYQSWPSYQWHWENRDMGFPFGPPIEVKIWVGGGAVVHTTYEYQPTVLDIGGYRYTRGTHYGTAGFGWQVYGFSRRLINPVYPATNGGIAGNAGRGQGYDGAASTGALPVAGGLNAGASGRSGNGAPYGGTGDTGGNGAPGNLGAGLAGAAGGLPGFFLRGAANAQFNNYGTVLGRVA